MPTIRKVTALVWGILTLVLGVCLLLAPGRFLDTFGWAPVEPILDRVLGAALLALILGVVARLAQPQQCGAGIGRADRGHLLLAGSRWCCAPPDHRRRLSAHGLGCRPAVTPVRRPVDCRRLEQPGTRLVHKKQDARAEVSARAF